MHLLLLLPCIIVSLASAIPSSNCPERFLSLTGDHSYCLPPNPQCVIHSSGVTDEEVEEILNVHNGLRSKVAMGKETSAPSEIPTASNMMQMVWDDELSAVAQKWAEQCHFDHDCMECRQIDSGFVGQNIALAYQEPKIDWEEKINLFYDEVQYFDDDVRAFRDNNAKNGGVVGHFAQVVWAKASRVGCGYVSYSLGEEQNQQFYVCNYGEGGNIPGDPLYEVGEPCSGCPYGTICCSDTCDPNGPEFPGLCKK